MRIKAEIKKYKHFCDMIEYRYDEKGRLIQEGNITYEYDEKGRLIRKDDITYEYDEKDNCIYSKSDKKECWYFYNSANECIHKRVVTKSMIFDKKKHKKVAMYRTNDITYEYDHHKNCVASIIDGHFKNTYKYNNRGKCIEECLYNGITNIIKYNRHGKRTHVISTGPIYSSEEWYNYDEQGNCIKTRCCRSDGMTQTITETEYVYE